MVHWSNKARRNDLDILRQSFESRLRKIEGRLEALENTQAELIKYMNPAESFGEEHDDRLLCLKNGLNYEEEKDKYMAYMTEQEVNTPAYQEWNVEDADAGPLIYEFDRQYPDLRSWLVSRLIEKEES